MTGWKSCRHEGRLLIGTLVAVIKAMPTVLRRNWAICCIVTVSACLRIVIAVRGGQGWWQDEARFNVSRLAASKLLIGHVHGAFRTLFATADHLGFKLLGVIPAIGVQLGLPLWTAAAFFGLFSTASLYLIWRIARIAAADEETANWAAFAAAISVSLFYFSRHLLPYDTALFFGLLSLLIARRDSTATSGFAAGIWAGTGFLVYNGYWLFCGVCLVVGVIGRATTVREAAWRLPCGLLGISVPIGCMLALGSLAGSHLLRSGVAFSHTVTLGDFDQGWSFPWKYLWRAEGWLLGFWALASTMGFILPGRRGYSLTWLLAIGAIVFGLGGGSNVLHAFVVYGRIARCLVPFIALLSANGLAKIAEITRHGAVVRIAVVAFGIGISVPHFAAPILQWFPGRFMLRAREIAAAQPANIRIRIINAHPFYSPIFVEEAPAENPLFARPHPMQFAPFLYENQTAWLRAEYRKRDMTMRVIRLKWPDPDWPWPQSARLDGYPGPIRMRVVLPPPTWEGSSPLAVTGIEGAGDFLYVKCVGKDMFQFGFDHWGYTRLSSPVQLKQAGEHFAEINMGSLLPPATSTLYSVHPQWEALRRRLFLRIDGQTVFDRPAAFYQSRWTQIDFGHNVIGGSTCVTRFSGQILQIAAIPPGEFLQDFRH